MHKFFITGLLAATVLSPVVAQAAPGNRDEARGNVRAEGNDRGQANVDRANRAPAQRAERRNAAPQQTAPIAGPQQNQQSRPVYAPPPASNVTRGDRAPRSQAMPAQQAQNRGQNRGQNQGRNPVATQPTQSATRGINNRYDQNNDGRLDRTWDRNRDGTVDRRFDRNSNGVVDRNYDRNRNGDIDRRYDRNNNDRLDRRYAGNRADRDNRHYYDNRDNRWHNNDRYRWNREWRNDRRYDWYGYRNQYRNHYRLGRYYAPYRDYSYRRFDIGFYLGSAFLASNYWINDPYHYRLPAAYDGTRWVRYYNDVLLVDTYTGEVLDVIHNFFW